MRAGERQTVCGTDSSGGKKGAIVKPSKEEPFVKRGEFVGTIPEALAWYRKNTTATQQKAMLIAYLEDHNKNTRLPFTDDKPYPQAIVESARACDEQGCVGMGSVARLLMLGAKLDKVTVERFQQHLKTLKVKVKPQRKPRYEPTDGLMLVCQQIDGVVDEIIESKRPKLPAEAKEKWRLTVTPAQREEIAKRYLHTYEEVYAAASEEDDELKEGYCNLNFRQMDALVNYLRSIVEYKKKSVK